MACNFEPKHIVTLNTHAMKNKHLLLHLFLLATATALTQNWAVSKFEASIGAGMIPTFAKDHSRNITIPLNAGFSYRVSERCSAGAFAGYSASSVIKPGKLTGLPVLHENRFRFAGIRIAAHTDPHQFDRWDFYGGMSGMFTLAQISSTPLVKSFSAASDEEKKRIARFTGTGFIGARFALTKRWGMWGELGFGAALVNSGLSYRFVPAGRSK